MLDTLAMALLLFSCASGFLYAQRIVDGAIDPEGIPDVIAYRIPGTVTVISNIVSRPSACTIRNPPSGTTPIQTYPVQQP